LEKIRWVNNNNIQQQHYSGKQQQYSFNNKPATIFFTFNYADNHWCDLHKLMPGKNKIRYRKLNNLKIFSGKNTKDAKIFKYA
jgi:hypothetical protein